MKFCVLIWFDFLFLGKNQGEAETKGERGLTEASATPWPNIRIFGRTWFMPTYEKSKLERLSGAKTLVVTQASSTNGKWKRVIYSRSNGGRSHAPSWLARQQPQ